MTKYSLVPVVQLLAKAPENISREQNRGFPQCGRRPKVGLGIPGANRPGRRETPNQNLLEKLAQLETMYPGRALPSFPDRMWERLRYKGKKLRRWLDESRSFRASPLAERAVWETFKRCGLQDRLFSLADLAD